MSQSDSTTAFHFKQFDVCQDRCAMKVGTDGVLLGAMAPLPSLTGPVSVLDIGTGTGLLSLMAAQRMADAGHTDFHIEAIDIDADAVLQASANAAQSPWANHISVRHGSLAQYAQALSPSARYDLILCNPPFYNATLKPTDAARATARHKDALPIPDIARFAQSHLSDRGLLSLIFPADYEGEVMAASILAQLSPISICRILTKVGKPCKRLISTFALRSVSTAPTTSSTLAIRDAEGNYTPEYRTLTDPFYISLK
ncbi:MAG: methyltransferase [Bacteroidales bacterium]|nr:methyltransferase [Bacteroidales bacterium]